MFQWTTITITHKNNSTATYPPHHGHNHHVLITIGNSLLSRHNHHPKTILCSTTLPIMQASSFSSLPSTAITRSNDNLVGDTAFSSRPPQQQPGFLPLLTLNVANCLFFSLYYLKCFFFFFLWWQEGMRVMGCWNTTMCHFKSWLDTFIVWILGQNLW